MANKRYLQAAQIAAAQRGFQTVFNQQHDQIEDPVRALAMEVSSKAGEESYSWFGDVPGLQEWLDDRPMSKLRAEAMTIDNKDYASGLEVDKNDILDDKLKMVKPKIMTLGRKAALHPGLMIGKMLLNGFDGTVVAWSDGKSYDGLYFFSATHLDAPGAATYNNISTAALAHDSYFEARAVMGSYLDEGAEFGLGIVPSTLVVGPTLERTALEIVGTNQRNDGANVQIENVMKNTAKVMISPALVGSFANYWFLTDLTQPIKPLIYQKREAAIFEAADDPKSNDVFMKKVLKYGASARYGFGYGDPHFCYGSDGSV
jgi:phage major head subunit gpT-like protein